MLNQNLVFIRVFLTLLSFINGSDATTLSNKCGKRATSPGLECFRKGKYMFFINNAVKSCNCIDVRRLTNCSNITDAYYNDLINRLNSIKPVPQSGFFFLLDSRNELTGYPNYYASFNVIYPNGSVVDQTTTSANDTRINYVQYAPTGICVRYSLDIPLCGKYTIKVRNNVQDHLSITIPITLYVGYNGMVTNVIKANSTSETLQTVYELYVTGCIQNVC